jgi:ABC-type lipoprotein export system ATPase subunit
MNNDQLDSFIETTPLDDVFTQYPYAKDFFTGIRLEHIHKTLPLPDALKEIPEDYLGDFGLTRKELIADFTVFIGIDSENGGQADIGIKSLTILGGQGKDGEREEQRIDIFPGEIIGIVGPTGAGKSRLLGDIECLAQRDTPTGRQILINGTAPDESLRFESSGKLVAQLSQNMNFVMDLTVSEFLAMHAESRMIRNPEKITAEIFECANKLTGERFSKDETVTQLSGGQSRALMIADTALLSNSPVVLIDEIENAGIDRKLALNLLVKKEKIVFMSTHDPLLALLADRRIVIKNGGIKAVIKTSGREQNCIPDIERMDRYMMDLRNRIRRGERIENAAERASPDFLVR